MLGCGRRCKGTMEFPRYLNKGSLGHHVTLLQVFLAGAGYGEGLVFDRDFGKATALAVQKFQRMNDIADDGNCGPETRQLMKDRYHFDFDAACAATPGFTVCVQGDGTKLLFEV